jgi:hypothetical protein
MHIYKVRGSEGTVQDWWPKASDDAREEVPSLDDPDIRADLVRRVRAEIAAGTYDTPEKFAQALDRMVSELR